MALSKTPLISAILQFADGLKFRQLFLITAALFLLNLIIPDPIPFFDELILGLLALPLGAMLLAGLPLLVFFLMQRYLVRGLLAGSVK